MYYNPSYTEFSGEGPKITLTNEEDTRLCSPANGIPDDDSVGENHEIPLTRLHKMSV